MIKVTKSFPTFAPFAITIEVNDFDQLTSLCTVVGKMSNDHGLDLYDLLNAERRKYVPDEPS